MASSEEQPKRNPLWFLDAKCPVFLPKLEALSLPRDQFEAHLTQLLKSGKTDGELPPSSASTGDDDTFTLVSEQTTTADARGPLVDLAIASESDTPMTTAEDDQPMHDVQSGSSGEQTPKVDMQNKMLTDKGDVTFQSTTNAPLDLFVELEDVISAPRLNELLSNAWRDNPLMTLKIIFNARSIHLGKASRLTFYRCAGWLAQNHPRTLIANLRWLSRPVIQKKAEKKEEGEDEMVVVESESSPDPDHVTGFDVRHGVAHGYWKDMLNILVLSAESKLSVLARPQDVLNVEGEHSNVSQQEAKEKRNSLRWDRHEIIIRALEYNPVHRALHLEVARLFADQLAADMVALRGSDNQAKRAISPCAKWAPSTDRFHDKHTFITSSIAEALYPEEYFVNKGILQHVTNDLERNVYLRWAREELRKDVSKLRKHLEVVERDLTAGTFSKIKYERVPSIAMSNYSDIFAEKDTERFESYLEKVASGKAQISGATLFPSTFMKELRTARDMGNMRNTMSETKGKAKLDAAIQERIAELRGKVLDGQWKTLVQRIKDSGTLENCIAVVDVSGSMNHPEFPDGTCPMDTSVGLGLLVAEVTEPPFGGSFITFSSTPSLERIDKSATLREKHAGLCDANWDMSTDFEAVFTELILKKAVEENLTQEQMVKRIFVFSDMQFDSAGGGNSWSTSFERIQKAYSEAGYEVPEMVFWNLAGGRHGIAPKPVTTDETGVALVSGYSQGMLKVFMDKGLFGEEDDEVIEMVDKVEDDEGLVTVEKIVKKQKLDPMATVRKAISHAAYSMLEVVD